MKSRRRREWFRRSSAMFMALALIWTFIAGGLV